MTSVNLHGILAQEFKKHFSFSIKRPKEVFDAISCSCPQFRNRLIELANQGIHYAILVDGQKIKSIHELEISHPSTSIDLVPLVCGAGPIAIIAIGAITFGAGFFASLPLLMTVGLAIASIGLQMALAPKPEMQRPEAEVGAVKQSFIFSSKANVAEQGIPVPVGYGRLRVGSAIIQSSIKSYPQAFNKEASLSVGEQEFDGQFLTNDQQE
jgi:predicted phage tail protein